MLRQSYPPDNGQYSHMEHQRNDDGTGQATSQRRLPFIIR